MGAFRINSEVSRLHTSQPLSRFVSAPMQTQLTAEQLERESTPLLAANLQAPALTLEALKEFRRKLIKFSDKCKIYMDEYQDSNASRIQPLLTTIEERMRVCEKRIQTLQMNSDGVMPAAPAAQSQSQQINPMRFPTSSFNVSSINSGFGSFNLNGSAPAFNLQIVVPKVQFPQPDQFWVSTPESLRHNLPSQSTASSVMTPHHPLPHSHHAHAHLISASPFHAIIASQMSQNLSDSYPEWVKQLVLPHQGDVVRMLPRPHTRYRLFPNAKQIGTIYGAICFGESVSDLKDVAVKITTWLHWEKTHTSSSECVLREIKHWHDLLHPASEAQLSLASPSQIAGLQHVIELIEVGYTDYEHWAVMPRARHGNLHDAIEEQARDSGFDELTAWEMFAQLLDSLDYVHFRGFAHLDVSLENCLLNENSDGEPFVLLCDFGQSRPMPRHGDSEAMFSINAPRGRKLYCSPPEYLVDSNSNFRYSGFRGSAVDVYAAGVILYSLLVSVYPFPNGATGSLYHSIFGQTAPSIVDREYFHRAEAGLRRLAYWHQNGSPYPGVDVFEGDSDVLNQEVIGSPLTLGAAEVLVRLLCWPEQRLTITQVRALPWMMQEPL